MRTKPSSSRSIAEEQLYFFRKTRFEVPGASRMSKPWSRSQVTASSYPRLVSVLAIACRNDGAISSRRDTIVPCRRFVARAAEFFRQLGRECESMAHGSHRQQIFAVVGCGTGVTLLGRLRRAK